MGNPFEDEPLTHCERHPSSSPFPSIARVDAQVLRGDWACKLRVEVTRSESNCCVRLGF